VKKTSDIFQFKMYPHGQGGLSQCRHFLDKRGGGQFFSVLCERFLRTAPNLYIEKSADYAFLLSISSRISSIKMYLLNELRQV